MSWEETLDALDKYVAGYDSSNKADNLLADNSCQQKIIEIHSPHAETAQSAQIPSEPISAYCANCAEPKLSENQKNSACNDNKLSHGFETQPPNAETAQYAQRPDHMQSMHAKLDEKVSSEYKDKLLGILDEACKELAIQPIQVYEALSKDDIEDYQSGDVTQSMLTVFARSLVQQQQMARGERPGHYTEQAICQHCGPVWLWTSGEVLGCPWCLNRVEGKSIPRPTCEYKYASSEAH